MQHILKFGYILTILINACLLLLHVFIPNTLPNTFYTMLAGFFLLTCLVLKLEQIHQNYRKKIGGIIYE